MFGVCRFVGSADTPTIAWFQTTNGLTTGSQNCWKFNKWLQHTVAPGYLICYPQLIDLVLSELKESIFFRRKSRGPASWNAWGKKNWELVKPRLKSSSVTFCCITSPYQRQDGCRWEQWRKVKWRSTEGCREKGGGSPDEKYNTLKATGASKLYSCKIRTLYHLETPCRHVFSLPSFNRKPFQ